MEKIGVFTGSTGSPLEIWSVRATGSGPYAIFEGEKMLRNDLSSKSMIQMLCGVINEQQKGQP